jgi:hypothetical protein
MKSTKCTSTCVNIIPHSNKLIAGTICIITCCQIQNPIVWFEGVKWRIVEMERPGQPEKSNRGTGGGQPFDEQSCGLPVIYIIIQMKLTSWYPQNWVPFVAAREAGLQQAIVLLVTKALMCQIDKSWAYESDLWAISERMPICASSWVLGMVCLFLFQFIHLQAIPIYYYLHLRLPHLFHYNLTGTWLRGCVRILYTVQSSFLFVYLLLLPYLLYLGCGLNDIPYGLHSRCSLSFVIFLQISGITLQWDRTDMAGAHSSHKTVGWGSSLLMFAELPTVTESHSATINMTTQTFLKTKTVNYYARHC